MLSELLPAIAVFSILTVAALALIGRTLLRALTQRIGRESLTPQDVLALQSAVDEMTGRIDEAADRAVARLEARERDEGVDGSEGCADAVRSRFAKQRLRPSTISYQPVLRTPSAPSHSPRRRPHRKSSRSSPPRTLWR